MSDDRIPAFAYLRISSRSQKSKFGLKTQRDDIDRVAKNLNLEVLRYYQDVATGRNQERRDFQLMTDDLRECDVKAVVIARVSRLGRNMREMLNWKFELDELGVRLFVADGGLVDTSTVSGKMMFYSMCMFAEIELDNMVEQMQKGLAKWKAKQRKVSKGG